MRRLLTEARLLERKTVPAKYVGGLEGKAAKARKAEVRSRSEEPHTDPKSYRPFKTDKDPKTGKPIKTRESSYTKAFKAKYGDQDGDLGKIAKATGVPRYILKKVYDRGAAAWRTGHRPGASQTAWGLARVYSFVMKGKTWRTADADLAKQAQKLSEAVRKIAKLSGDSASEGEIKRQTTVGKSNAAVQTTPGKAQRLKQLMKAAGVDTERITPSTSKKPEKRGKVTAVFKKKEQPGEEPPPRKAKAPSGGGGLKQATAPLPWMQLGGS